ncbi:MAG: DUF4957 domain-containing protein [Bacteroidales bacterium]|nr:DUF4957 domain-containing protein [Bacteroidales bacterium]
MKKSLTSFGLTLLCFALGSNAVCAKTAADSVSVTDELAITTFGSPTSYSDVSGIKAESGAVYAGNMSGGNNNYIQLRATKPSGIVSTNSGGAAKSVRIVWNDATTNTTRTVDVYGKNEAYTTGEDLYSNDTQGTKIASFKKSEGNQTLALTGDYKYIGIRSNSGALYLDSIKIVWKDVVSSIEKPEISGETPVKDAAQVTITAEEGATIYYTIDGTEPSAASTAYSAPFTLNESATVKAIAVKDGATSGESEKVFTVQKGVASLAELSALADGTNFYFKGNAYVTFKNGSNTYLADGTGYTMMYGTANVVKGNTLTPEWTGKVSMYNGLFEVVPTSTISAVEGGDVTVTYDEGTFADTTTQNKIIVMKGVTYTDPGTGKSLKIVSGNDSVPAYNNLGLTIEAPREGSTYTIVAAVGFSKVAQFNPISITLEAAVVAVNIAPEDGDISEALSNAIKAIEDNGNQAGDITINLKNGVTYSITKSIMAPAAVAIYGNGATIAAADTMSTPIIKMSATPAIEANADGYYVIPSIDIKQVNVVGVNKQFFYCNKTKYLINEFHVDSTYINVNSGNSTIFDFNGGGVVGMFEINNSTIASPDSAHTGQLFSTQSSQKVVDEAKLSGKTISIQNSTFYKIAYGVKTCALRQNNQTWLSFIVKRNNVVNCGKKGQFLRGLNGGTGGAAPTWDVEGNAFTYNGEDVSDDEIDGDKDEPVRDNVKGIMLFADPANGLFYGNFQLDATMASAPATLGDPRWSESIIYTYLPANIALTLESGKDISKAVADTVKTFTEAGKVVNDITINLAKEGSYTVSDSIVVFNKLTINGNGATIDASALAVPMLQMAKTPVVTAATDALGQIVSYPTDGVVISGVTIKGLAYQLFYANKVNYLLSTLEVNNSVIGINGANNKTIFDFNGGGNTVELKVENSTIWANPSNAQNGGFYSSQSGQSVEQLGGSQQLTSIKNSTIYNIASGKTLSTRRANNKDWMTYEVQNCVIVNSGKSGQFVKGLNAGQSGANPTWSISGNVFNFDGKDTSADESTGDEAEPVQNSIAGIVAFTDAANGDLNGTFTYPFGTTAPESIGGDPRWTISAVEGNDTGISNIAASMADGATFNLYGQRTNASFNGFGIKAGKVIFQK